MKKPKTNGKSELCQGAFSCDNMKLELNLEWRTVLHAAEKEDPPSGEW